MSTIHKQLVTDEKGRPVGVLIPYEEWLRIEQQLEGAAAAEGIVRNERGRESLFQDHLGLPSGRSVGSIPAKQKGLTPLLYVA